MPIGESQGFIFAACYENGKVVPILECSLDSFTSETECTATIYPDTITWSTELEVGLGWSNNYRKFHHKPLMRGRKLKRMRKAIDTLIKIPN